MTACTLRYPIAEPVQRFAILDLTEPQLHMLVAAAGHGLNDLALDGDSDYETAAELTSILQQARGALGQ
ncbi:hypothetical protein D1114_21545 [Cereibacter sphaeroides]|uniref:Uncharacterized protein n=1 Tax=Cereibacter sphaeroides TaxID=1063 RepID=A0AAX1UF86_CERSP|nr:hypothetical protein [Cereibacter sphaeroides]RHZ91013.1 hypothetical protein D1114_21545 [Cereibacter sphaeroides]